MTIPEAIERLRELQQGDEPSISYEDLEAIIELIKQKAERVMEWRPIETAPTEEEYVNVVLLSRNTDIKSVMPAIYDGRDWRALTIAGMMIYTNPTHWMPLPDPPHNTL